MLNFTSVNKLRGHEKEYDEIWIIARTGYKLIPSYEKLGIKTRHVIDFAPSTDLFNKVQQAKADNTWNQEAFDSWYTKQYIQEFDAQMTATAFLMELASLANNNTNIALVCFCSDAAMCHRSILANLLQQRFPETVFANITVS